MEASNSEYSSEHGSNDLTARSSFTEKNGLVLFTMCPTSSRARACNLRHTNEGQSLLQKSIHNKTDPFAYFMDENILKQVVKHTNERARRDLRKRGKFR